MPASWRERVDTASAVHSILDSYPTTSILREILQNSDDARATEQIFILDHRHHGTRSILDPALERTQGPALLAVNDSLFRNSDWAAVRTIHGSNKGADETKTGKYGLGIRACYHITDNIHILSGDKLVVFDPHEEFAPPCDGGTSISLKEERHRYEDQLAAFSGALSGSLDSSKLTVLRLPLRTAIEAARSRVKSESVTPSDIRDLYESFVENELGVALLFLNNILRIELREVAEDGKETLVAKAEILNRSIATKRSFLQSNSDQFEHYQLDISTSSTIDSPGPLSVSSKSWRIVHVVLAERTVKSMMDNRLGYDVGDRLKKDKLSSHVALAFPLTRPHFEAVQPTTVYLQPSLEGRLFTLLPLPIFTGFPLHVHGIFALTPDRQNLRNAEELGIGKEARERLLVFWNRFILNEVVPKAWVALLRTLVEHDSISNIWSAWPLTEASIADIKGQTLLARFVELSLSCEQAIFPTPRPTRGELEHISPTATALVCSPLIASSLCEAVSKAGVCVIRPPPHIYRALVDAGFAGSAFRDFNPQNLHSSLQDKVANLQSSTVESQDRILEYLINGSISYIIGLPLVPTVRGSRVSLYAPASAEADSLILVSSAEVALFRDCAEVNLICLSDLSVTVRGELEQAAKRNQLNIEKIRPRTLERLLDRLSESDSSLSHSWYTGFWTWLDGHQKSDSFFKTASSYRLLPMLDDTRRQVSDRAFIVPAGHERLLHVLQRAGIPFLHTCINSTRTLSCNGVALTVDNIPMLVDHLAPELITTPSDRLILQEHIAHCIQSQRITLRSTLKHRFCLLPIFPHRKPDTSNGCVPVTVLEPAREPRLFIDVPEDFPVPKVDVAFFDLSASSLSLGRVIQSDASSVALRDVKLMELAIEHLSGQPPALQDLLMQRIVPDLFKLSEEKRESLRRQTCVPALGLDLRLAPKDVIDPGSTLEPIFRGEQSRFPAPPYSDGTYLMLMQNAKLFCNQLTPDLLQERIAFIGSFSPERTVLAKAEALLIELKQWNPSFASVLKHDLGQSWIPTVNHELVSRQHSRDVQHGEHAYLFDQVLSQCSQTLPASVREALGWSPWVGTDVLEKQLRFTLELPNISNRSERLLVLIRYIARTRAEGRLSFSIISLRGIVKNIPWIPFSRHIRPTQHALLAPNQSIGDIFHSIPSRLREAPGVLTFLREMGCSERPNLDAIIDVLSSSETLQIPDRLELLNELAKHENEVLLHSKRGDILVPAANNTLFKLSELYLNDMGQFTPVTERVAAHPSISQTVARGIGLEFLSSLQLDEGDDLDIDDEDMEEAIATRIKAVLVDYDQQYSLSEFLANAADAGAYKFAVLLDRKGEDHAFSASRIISPDMRVFHTVAAMVLYNDAQFSENDFKGLRKIGEGGKQANEKTIGKFGLGALSFYHFAEIAFIVSGEYVMILDPSATYLPRRRGQKRRCFWRKLKDARRYHPDQLAPLEGLFGFSLDLNSYPGTLIRLPLRHTTDGQLLGRATSSNECYDLLVGPYQDLAKDSTHFTCLTSIMAQQRLFDNDVKQLWSVARHIVPRTESPCHAELMYDIDLQNPMGTTKERWLSVKDSFPLTKVPSKFHRILCQPRVVNAIEFGLAFRISVVAAHTSSTLRTNYLFCGLRLPEATSIPAQVHASFSVSSDRRCIRLDPPDDGGRRVLQSEYNAWILSSPLPDIYLRALHLLFDVFPERFCAGEWWPTKAKDHGASKEFTTAFYTRAVPRCTTPILPTVTRQLVSPADAVLCVPFQVPKLVRDLLSALQVNTLVVRPSIISLLPLDEFNSLDSNALVEILRREDVESRLYGLFNSSKDTDARVVDMVDAALHFILGSDSEFEHSLPLLVTQDLQLLRFNENPTTFHDLRDFPDKLFQRRYFISSQIKRETLQLLLKSPSYKVRTFDIAAMISFMERMVGKPSPISQHSQDTIAWIELMWSEFPFLPRGDILERTAAYPLFPTVASALDRRYVSLTHCRSGGALPDPKNKQLQQAMLILDIPVLSPHHRLPDELVLQFSYETLIKCLMRKGAHVFHGVAVEDLEPLVNWMISNQRLIELNSAQLAFLASLPLWRAIRGDILQFSSADDLHSLPSGIPLERIRRFLQPNISIAEYSPNLKSLYSHLVHGNRRIISYNELPAMLDLPEQLAEDEISDYLFLLTQLIEGGVDELRYLRVPNGQGRLRPAGEYLDSSADLFQAAFWYSASVKFFHPEFRPLELMLPIKRQITRDLFRQCAQEIHDDQLHDRTDRLLERANVVNNHYNDLLPRANVDDWGLFDHLCFVPRTDTPIEFITYDTAWTQRGRFRAAPARDLIAVHPKIGTPTPEEVVEHLVVLATRVAQDHPHNASLIRDLKATYKWLKKNRKQAKAALLAHRKIPMFLNVTDIDRRESPWVWRSADQLLFGLSYDDSNYFTIQDFLLQYDSLLSTAGVLTRISASHKDDSRIGDTDFEKLRQHGHLFDVDLIPEYAQEDELPMDKSRLKAHAAFLAAKVPHIADALTGGWIESKERELKFPGNYFAACAFLDLLYTGDIMDERDSENGKMLTNLLEMLEDTKPWNVSWLKTKIGWLIAEKYDFLERDTLQMIRDKASECDAPELVQACDRWAKDNTHLVGD